MSIIEEYIPRTMHHNDVKSKDAERAKIAKQIEVFFEGGGHIKDIPTGHGTFQEMKGSDYLRAVHSAGTLCNAEKRKKALAPIRR